MEDGHTAIEIVSFPMKNGDFPVRYVSHYQRVDFFLINSYLAEFDLRIEDEWD